MENCTIKIPDNRFSNITFPTFALDDTFFTVFGLHDDIYTVIADCASSLGLMSMREE